MSYTLLKETKRKARKEHQCIWCPEKIEKGTSYVEERSVYDNELQFIRWHPECKEAAKNWFRETREEEFTPNSWRRGTCEER